MRLNELASGKTGLIGFGRESRALEAVMLARWPQAQIQVIAEQAPETAPQHWPITVQSLDEAELNFDRIVRSPGVPVDHPALVSARGRGVEISTTSSLWFAERSEARTIVVTGSKGKSTTTALIAHLLKACGQSVALAGNIGIPLIGLLDQQADWFVIELSSYQLADLQAALDVGVITRLFPEHVDWHGSVEQYYAAKLRLMDLLQGRSLWVNATDPVLMRHVAGYSGLRAANAADHLHARSDGLYCSQQRLLAADDWPLMGRHNLDNLAVAASVVTSLGFDPDEVVSAARAFQPLPHRLQRCKDAAGRDWINDSISTTPYATEAALSCCTDDVVLIVGGLERNADWHAFAEQRRVQSSPGLTGLVALPDNGARIADVLIQAGLVAADRVKTVADMADAVRAARKLAGPRSQVLLSPGAPSFPRYRNFEDRGDQFMQAIAAD